MPRRTTPPLTNAERRQRYRANHPEKREEHRLAMQKLRAARRQQADLQRLALVAPANDEDPIRALPAFKKLTALPKITTGLTQEELLQDIQGSKV